MDIPVMQDILGRNDEIAGKNKSLFNKHGILAIIYWVLLVQVKQLY